MACGHPGRPTLVPSQDPPTRRRSRREIPREGHPNAVSRTPTRNVRGHRLHPPRRRAGTPTSARSSTPPAAPGAATSRSGSGGCCSIWRTGSPSTPGRHCPDRDGGPLAAAPRAGRRPAGLTSCSPAPPPARPGAPPSAPTGPGRWSPYALEAGHQPGRAGRRVRGVRACGRYASSWNPLDLGDHFAAERIDPVSDDAQQAGTGSSGRVVGWSSTPSAPSPSSLIWTRRDAGLPQLEQLQMEWCLLAQRPDVRLAIRSA
jgi:hypothetical protein